MATPPVNLPGLRALLGQVALTKTTSVTDNLGLHKLQGGLTQNDADVRDVVNDLIDAVDDGGGGGGGGAPTTATYLTLTTNGTLTNERVATAGTGLTATDGGAGSTWTLALDATASPTFVGLTLSGLTASRYVVTNGSKALTSQTGIPLADLQNAGGAPGDLAYWNGSAWVRLAVGASGRVLFSNGSGAPVWSANPVVSSITADGFNFTPATGGATRLLRVDGAGDVDVVATGTDGHVLTLVAGAPAWQAASGGGAPVGAQYLCLANDATLTNERRVVLDSTLAALDGGAGGNWNLGVAVGGITNAFINASAAIDGIKISPDFGSQVVQTTGSFQTTTGFIGIGSTTLASSGMIRVGRTAQTIINWRNQADSANNPLLTTDASNNAYFGQAADGATGATVAYLGGTAGTIIRQGSSTLLTCNTSSIAAASGLALTWNAGASAALATLIAAQISTTDATVTTVRTFNPTANSAGVADFIVVGHRSDGGATYIASIRVPYKKDGTTLTILGSPTATVIATDGTTAGMALTASASGGTALIRVTGIAATTFRWGCFETSHLRTTA